MTPQPLTSLPKALFFDVFGTCVDWRSTVTSTLQAQAHASLNDATASLASRVRLRASEMTVADWGDFAQQWRNTYQIFTRRLAADPNSPWKTVDQHHLESLQELLTTWQLAGLWTDEQVRDLSLVWHRLDPWSDSARGIALLNTICSTSTLSNGNISLLSDLQAHGNMNFTHILSGEMFGSYKPSPKVYLGAVEKLGLQPQECAMVAAHLNDLQAAKSHGLRTIYVERPCEDEWSADDVEKAKQEGWVDIWVSQGDGNRGFITVASRLGAGVSADEGE